MNRITKLSSALFLAIITIIFLLSALFIGGQGTPPTLAAPSLQFVARDPFIRHLDTNGDGTGTKNATGNYTTTTAFYIEPPGTSNYIISRLVVEIEAVGTFTGTLYGGQVITNGVAIKKQDDTGELIDFTDGVSITTNAGWARFCYDETITGYTGNNYIRVDCDLSRSGSLLRLNGSSDEHFDVLLNDDFSGLISHRFIVYGFTE